jgi:hypothetical protein
MLVHERIEKRTARGLVAASKSSEEASQAPGGPGKYRLQIFRLLRSELVSIEYPGRDPRHRAIARAIPSVAPVARVAFGVEKPKPFEMTLLPELLRGRRQQERPARSCGEGFD